MKRINDIYKKNNFAVPEGYFDKIEMEASEKFFSEQSELSKVSLLQMLKPYMYVAIFVLIVIMACVSMFMKPDPHAILREEMFEYDYFLGAESIIEYKDTSAFQYVHVKIKAIIDPDKIPELIGTRLLKDCDKVDLSCSEPLWYLWSGSSELQDFIIPGITDLDPLSSEPGLRCTSAADPKLPERRRTDICINMDTGVLTYRKLRY